MRPEIASRVTVSAPFASLLCQDTNAFARICVRGGHEQWLGAGRGRCQVTVTTTGRYPNVSPARFPARTNFLHLDDAILWSARWAGGGQVLHERHPSSVFVCVCVCVCGPAAAAHRTLARNKFNRTELGWVGVFGDRSGEFRAAASIALRNTHTSRRLTSRLAKNKAAPAPTCCACCRPFSSRPLHGAALFLSLSHTHNQILFHVPPTTRRSASSSSIRHNNI
jgi:hypothetical protein